MAAYVVARVEELPPGSRKIVEVAGRSVGVFHVNGEFVALRNRCPHQGGPLCRGPLTGFLIGDRPGEYRYSRAGEILRCPWHGWEFDLRTGRSWFDPVHTRVRSYPVGVRTGAELAVVERAEAPPAPGLVPGPYQAEMYQVTVDAKYVFVEVAS